SPETDSAGRREPWFMRPEMMLSLIGRGRRARPPRTRETAVQTCQRDATPVILDARVVRGSGGGPDKTILSSPRFLTPLGYRTLCAYMHDPDDAGFDRLRGKAERWQAPLVSVADRGPLDWPV